MLEIMTDSTRQFERDRLFKKWGQFMSAGAIPNTTMSPNVGFSNKSLSSTQDTPNSTVSLGRRDSSAKLTLKAFKLHSHESSRKK